MTINNYIKREQQVCSLELAKRLKELGVKQESWLNWIKDYDRSLSGWRLLGLDIPDSREGYSAFTVAELGELIRKREMPGYDELESVWCYLGKDGFITAEREADARAKMLIYLLENKLISTP